MKTLAKGLWTLKVSTYVLINACFNFEKWSLILCRKILFFTKLKCTISQNKFFLQNGDPRKELALAPYLRLV